MLAFRLWSRDNTVTRQDAGRLGGQATRDKYGVQYLRDLGASGGLATHRKYRLVPVGTRGWAYVNRQTDKIEHKWLCSTDYRTKGDNANG